MTLSLEFVITLEFVLKYQNNDDPQGLGMLRRVNALRLVLQGWTFSHIHTLSSPLERKWIQVLLRVLMVFCFLPHRADQRWLWSILPTEKHVSWFYVWDIKRHCMTACLWAIMSSCVAIFLWTGSAGLHCAILVPQLTSSWVCTRLSSWCCPSIDASYLATSHSPTQIHPAMPVGIPPLSHLVSLVLLHIRLLLPLKLALTALWELVPLVGVAVMFGWNCSYLMLMCTVFLSFPSH